MIRKDLSIDAFLHNFKKPFLLLVLHRHPVGFVPMASILHLVLTRRGAAIWLFQEACGVNTGQHLHFLL